MSHRLASHTPVIAPQSVALAGSHRCPCSRGRRRLGAPRRGRTQREWIVRRDALRYYSRFRFAGYDKHIPNSANGRL
jgi:hypothetical protein